MFDNTSANLATQKKVKNPGLQNPKEESAIVYEPAPDVLPLRAHGEEQQVAAPDAKAALPHLSQSPTAAPHRASSDMLSPKSANSKPGSKAIPCLGASGTTGSKTFAMQTREIDEARARKPDITIPQIENDCVVIPGPQDKSNGDGFGVGKPFRKPGKNNKKKFSGDYHPAQAGQLKTYNGQATEQNKGNRYDPDQRNDDKSLPASNKPCGPPRGGKRSMSFHENQGPHGQHQNRLKLQSLRGDPRRQLHDRPPYGQPKSFEGDDSSSFPQRPPFHGSHGFRDQHGACISFDTAPAHPYARMTGGMSRLMQKGLVTNASRGISPSSEIPMPPQMPPQFGTLPLHFTSQQVVAPSNVASPSQQSATTRVPPSLLDIPKRGPSGAQYTRPTESNEFDLPVVPKIPPSVAPSNGSELRKAPTFEDNRPVELRLPGLITSALAEIAYIQQRNDPAENPPQYLMNQQNRVYHLGSVASLLEKALEATHELCAEGNDGTNVNGVTTEVSTLESTSTSRSVSLSPSPRRISSGLTSNVDSTVIDGSHPACVTPKTADWGCVLAAV